MSADPMLLLWFYWVGGGGSGCLYDGVCDGVRRLSARMVMVAVVRTMMTMFSIIMMV